MSKIVTLSSDMPLIFHKMSNFQSFVLGIWIKHGSRHEPAHKSGLSHFIEHLFFQGTKKRTAKEISLEIDSIGGDLNAFTAREFTSIYVKGLKKDLHRLVELISDIYLNPLFPSEEIEKERSIILDEIRMINDTPEELTHDLFMENSYKSNLGLPILGKEETIRNLKRSDILDCFEKYYGTENCIISCAGNFDEKILIEALEKNITKKFSHNSIKLTSPNFCPVLEIYQKDLQEIHICLGIETVPFKSNDRHALILLNCIIGGSVSSRLFQEIREKRGLAYNIYSFVSFYSDTGLLGIYTAFEPSKLDIVVDTIKSILKNLRKTLKNEEIERAKKQVISQILFSSDSPSSVMQNLAYQTIYLDKIYKLKEQISLINKVTIGEIKRMAELLESRNFSLTIVGPVKEEKINF